MSVNHTFALYTGRVKSRLSRGLRGAYRGARAHLRASLRLLKDAGSGWLQHRSERVAAAIAYYGIFSMAPLIVIAVSVASLWFGQEAAEGLVVDHLRGTLGEDVARFVESLLTSAYVGGGGLVATIIAVVALLFGASRVLGGMRSALNDIWGVGARAGGGVKGFVVAKLFDLGMVLAIGFMFLATMMANTAVSIITGYFSDALPLSDLLLRTSSLAFSLVVVTFFMTVVFRLLPNTRPPWRDVLVGASVTAVLFTLGNYAIGVYLGRAGLSSVFGAAGALVVIMVWIYYSVQIILFGAEITRARYHLRRQTCRDDDEVGQSDSLTPGRDAGR